jgi:ligand-binding sensor domain-containing protein
LKNNKNHIHRLSQSCLKLIFLQKYKRPCRLKFVLPVFLLIIYLEVLNHAAFAQNYPFREYSVLDGLPQSQARGLYQDSRGFLWIMTRNGVSRFDGYEFRNYFRKDGLPTSTINQIFEDNKGYIWALSTKGLSKYNGYRFEHYPFEFPKQTESGSYISNSADTITILLKNNSTGYFRVLCFKDGKFFNHPKYGPVYDTLNTVINYYDVQGDYFLFIDTKFNAWKRMRDGTLYFLGEGLRDIIKTRKGPLLAGRNEFYEVSGNRLIPYMLSNTEREGRAASFATEKGYFIRYFDGYDLNIIRPPAYSSLFIDNESNLWLGSEVNLYKLLSTAFNYLGPEDGLPVNTWAMVEDKNGHIWFGTITGDLIEFDGEKLIPRNEHRKLFESRDIAFYKGSIRASDGKVYFSLNAGVLVWDGVSFKKIPGIPEKAQVCIIYEDPVDRSLFFGTGYGLYHLKNGKMDFFPEFAPGGYGLIEGILRDDSGKYWLSGENGIFEFDGKNPIPLLDSIMPSGYTYTLVKDSRGGIWITSDEGLFYKENQTDRLRYGLPEEINNSANSIIVMDSSRIMVGRMTDICIINTDKFYRNDPDYFRIYDKSNGFTGSECLDNGIIRDQKGRFWILTSGKAIILDPRRLRPNMNPPVAMVTDIEYETDSLAWKSLRIPDLFYNRQGKEIRIKNKQKNLKFRFTGLSATNPEKIEFQHRLVGIENIWSDRDPEREVEYKNLKPGNYVFQLKAINADGVESKEVYGLNFVIVPGFYQTWFFRITVTFLSALFLMVATWWYTRFNIRKKQEQLRMRNELWRLQMNSVIRQFDPHFMFNVVSSVGSLVMKGEKETSYNYIVKLSGLLRTMLADNTTLVRTVAEEIDFVKRYCELQKLRFRDRLRYTIDVNQNVNLQRLIPKMTIQTFVENSIKHGIENKIEGGFIKVKINEINNSLEIIVIDDGVGREKAESISKGGSGYGLKTIKSIFDFTNRMNRTRANIDVIDLKDERDIACGTEIRISIPDDYVFESVQA